MASITLDSGLDNIHGGIQHSAKGTTDSTSDEVIDKLLILILRELECEIDVVNIDDYQVASTFAFGNHSLTPKMTPK